MLARLSPCMVSQTHPAELGAAEPIAVASGDAELAQRCADGDSDAVELLYRAHSPAVRAMARLHASHAAATDDLVHDTFVRALELMPRYRGEAPMGVWLRGIAFNLARTERRRVARRAVLLRRHPPQLAPAAAPDGRAALQALDSLLDRLPGPEREAFCLRSVQHLSLEEVSTLLGVAVSTVSDRDRRAKDKLRRWMKEGS